MARKKVEKTPLSPKEAASKEFAADIFAETHRIFRRVQLRKPVQCRIP